MVRLGQFVQGKHAEDGCQCSAQNSHRKGDGYKSRPPIEGTAADVQRVGDRHSPVLKDKSSDASRQATKKTNQRHHVALQAQRFIKTFDGKWRIGIHAVVAGGPDFLYSMNELFGIPEFTHHAVYVRALQHYFLFSDVSATSSRISAMEIAGSTRTNKKRRVPNIPMVPMNGAQSQNLWVERPQAERTNTRDRVMTTRTKR